MLTNNLIKDKAKEFKIPKNVGTKQMQDAFNTFFNGKTGKFGNYFATKNALVYRSVSIVDDYQQDVICLRLIQNNKIHYLGNSSRFKVVDLGVSFGKRNFRWGESIAQQAMRLVGVPMLPFDSFIQAGLKITNTVILDQTGSETIKRITRKDSKGRPLFENVHFTGASLFKNQDQYFLFDIDREEIKHGIFNPFIVNLSKPVNTIKDAYDSLIPLEVRTAQIEGKKVLRQGEHFFIKIADSSHIKPDKEITRWSQKEEFKRARLSVQGNRDHVATRFNEHTGLVSGEVEHNGREHKNLDLSDGWYKPVPNTAARSFTLTGDID